MSTAFIYHAFAQFVSTCFFCFVRRMMHLTHDCVVAHIFQGRDPCHDGHPVSCRWSCISSRLAFGTLRPNRLCACFHSNCRHRRPSCSPKNQKKSTLVRPPLFILASHSWLQKSLLPQRLNRFSALQSVIEFIKLASFFYGFVSSPSCVCYIYLINWASLQILCSCLYIAAIVLAASSADR